MSKLKILVLTSLLIFTSNSMAQFAIEDSDEDGTTNPVDYSWRYYEEALKRFPSRVGITCHAAYILDKTGSYTKDAHMFMKACAEHGSVAAMIYLSYLHENGNRMPINYELSAYWLKRGAETKDEAGLSDLAAYHYGVALLNGRGVEKNEELAREYLQRAADAGIENALPYLKDLHTNH